jgi:integrase
MVRLFDTIDAWEREPLSAFKSFLRCGTGNFKRTSGHQFPPLPGKVVAENSAFVYEAMFNNFLGHIASHGVSLVDVEIEHVRSFVTGPLGRNTKQTIWRYTRLLQRVYDHLIDRGRLAVNPVSQWIQTRLEAGESPRVGRESIVPAAISLADVSRLQDWLLARGLAEMRLGNWRTVRDLTLSSLSLGTGMRCAELMILSRDQVQHRPGSSPEHRFGFQIPGWASVATARAHETRADVACVELMEQWWTARWEGFTAPSKDGIKFTRIVIPGAYIFPSRMKGTTLDPSTLFKNLKRLSKMAVADGALDEKKQWVLSRGAQGLRRAYVLSELEAGSAEGSLASRMGLWSEYSIRRHYHNGPVDDAV